ncbi:hypothetical protein CORC01_09496, partial [Colletotrichum orchidophilum]
FKKRDNEYFFRYNIKIKRLSDKLNYKKLKPFEIIKKVLLINFKLKLLDTI